MAAAYIISYLISFSAVIMRFISRRIGRISYHSDDWSIVVALVGYHSRCWPSNSTSL